MQGSIKTEFCSSPAAARDPKNSVKVKPDLGTNFATGHCTFIA